MLSPQKAKKRGEWLKKRDDFLRALAKRQQIIILEPLLPYCEACRRTKTELERIGKKLLRHHISYSPIETITLCTECHHILHDTFLSRKKCVSIKEKNKDGFFQKYPPIHIE